MKRIWISSAVCVVILLMVGCSSNKTPAQNTVPPSTQSGTSATSKQDLTLTELKKYNGENGNPAYVAIDGVIYDVTNAKGWSNGKHKDGITAGRDLSKEIDASPHGRDVLKTLPVVGKLK